MNEDEKQNEVENQVAEGPEPSLSKGERKKLRREEKLRQREMEARVRKRRKLIKRAVLVAVPVLVIGGIVWFVKGAPEISDDDVVSSRGIHWHPSLSITINGEQRDIPGTIGTTGGHSSSNKDIHTHQVNDNLHVEMNRKIREDDIRVKRFFDIWGEQFTSECILDVCNGEDGTVKMLVNGEENFEFENYLMQDRDRIEIVFE